MAKIAVTPNLLTGRFIHHADGWSVAEIVCTAGPRDRPFEEQHQGFTIALVLSGTFQYRANRVRRGAAGELMTPGSLMLGNPGQCFECGHEHAAGDRCLSFHYSPERFSEIAAGHAFPALRLPPLREMSPLAARAIAMLAGSTSPMAWEELSLEIAAQTLRLTNGRAAAEASPSASARITRAARTIESGRSRELTLATLAREARLSPFHFLRQFERLIGLTPHQYLRRVRLRDAATRLLATNAKILDVALDAGFGDVSNFNRAFRVEFGTSPRTFRAQERRHVGAA